MCTPVVIDDLESWTGGYGLGPQLFRVGERVYVGHGGSMPGYVAHLAVHRKSRLGVVVFANAYGLTGTGIKPVSLAALTAVLESEPDVIEPWKPPAPPSAEAAELAGRWWWMGREYEVVAVGDEVVMRCLTVPYAPWRFTREGGDRWRGRTGDNAGEILQVLRDADGTVATLDIATFVFKKDPSHLA
jgi:hypothetical protein